MHESEIFVSLDRIEEGIAVILTRESYRWLLPVEQLPEGTSEGDILRVRFRRDPEETAATASRIGDLQHRLLDRTGEKDGD